MKIFLLTHSREAQKPSNTGKLVINVLGDCVSRIIWNRTQPDARLLNHLRQFKTGLVYPNNENDDTNISVSDIDSYIVIDSTWQEARKIYNHSPYLHHLPRIQLTPSEPSGFTLRRNQIANGLCTAECVRELLKQRGQTDLASTLNNHFLSFIEQQQKH